MQSIRQQLVEAYDDQPLTLTPAKLLRAVASLKRRLEWLDVRISIKEERGEPCNLDKEEAGGIRVILELGVGTESGAETLASIEAKVKDKLLTIKGLEETLKNRNAEIGRLNEIMWKNGIKCSKETNDDVE